MNKKSLGSLVLAATPAYRSPKHPGYDYDITDFVSYFQVELGVVASACKIKVRMNIKDEFFVVSTPPRWVLLHYQILYTFINWFRDNDQLVISNLTDWLIRDYLQYI